jgi:hypothetical protein
LPGGLPEQQVRINAAVDRPQEGRAVVVLSGLGLNGFSIGGRNEVDFIYQDDVG